MRSNFALTAEQRQDARAALAILDGTGISLQQAAAVAVQGRRALVRCTVDELIEKFLPTRLQTCRRSTFDWYDERLRQVSSAFGSRTVDTVTRSEIREWLGNLPHAAARAANARAIRALWRWAMEQEPPLAAQNVASGLVFAAAPRRPEIKAFSVAECAAMMAGAKHHRSALALMLFAGLRPEEVASSSAGKAAFLWDSINLHEQIIRVPAEVSKTGRARILEGLPPAVWRWLQPGRGEICATQARAAVETAADAAKIEDWPQDGLRHTFASYAIAFTNDPGKVALWLGHEGNPTMLHRHYRGLVTQADAKAFFALKP
jgi:integrase